jgi:hypothetical protein
MENLSRFAAVLPTNVSRDHPLPQFHPRFSDAAELLNPFLVSQGHLGSIFAQTGAVNQRKDGQIVERRNNRHPVPEFVTKRKTPRRSLRINEGFLLLNMVPEARIELARHCWHKILNLACLPIPPPGQGSDIVQKNRPTVQIFLHESRLVLYL